ncbi:MAG: DUF924 family protein [Pseudomonadota bacterium]
MIDTDVEAVLHFWLEACAPADWYKVDADLDETIRQRFADLWEQADMGGLHIWTSCPKGALAYCILTDQFPRNMFRGSARAFATDWRARVAAKRAINQGYDQRVAAPGRQFFYLPLEHSESMSDQARAVGLIANRMDSPETLLHARVHREVIRRFGRFPFRNEALGREMSTPEAEFMSNGAYGAILREFQAAA